jgi:uncharacterized protein
MGDSAPLHGPVARRSLAPPRAGSSRVSRFICLDSLWARVIWNELACPIEQGKIRLSLKREIDRGDLEALRRRIDSKASLASTLIAWGPILCRCRTEPLHYLSDGPFNQLWSHGKQAEIARALLEAGAPVDGLPASGESPLHGAASLGEVGVAEVLVEFGADMEKQASYPGIPDGMPLDFAVHFGMIEVVDLLVAKEAKILSARIAAGAGLLDELKKMLKPEQRVDVFRCACICNRVEIVEYLFGEGLDINVDIEGASALHWAAREAKPKMVQFLVGKGANRDLRDRKHHMTPAEWASHRGKELGRRWGHEKVLELLSEN